MKLDLCQRMDMFMCLLIIALKIFFSNASTDSTDDQRTVQEYIETILMEINKSKSFIGPRNAYSYKPQSDYIKDFGQFHYIVVGGGSAGAVLASRLSENPTKRVLLLEAGGTETVFGNIPGLSQLIQAQDFDWHFYSIPQNSSCLGMANRQCAYPRGKGLGGSSLINALMYSRGHKEDYDKWEEMGNKDWNYNDCLKYFKKSEHFNIPGDLYYHGTQGPLNVEYHVPDSPQFTAFIEANKELGYEILDYNGESILGASRTQFNYINGKRLSSAKAFLHPVRSRRNLKVLTHAYATKILIENDKKIAQGVLFTYDNIWYKARAKTEVVVSAGVIGSPQLLMLSGIGPRDHLESLNIPVIKDLPVGKNFQEHPGYHALFFSSNYTEPIRSMETYVKQFLKGYGPYTINANLQGVGFYKSKYNKDNTSQNADFEIIVQPSNNTGNIMKTIHHYSDETFDAIWENINPARSFTLIPVVLHPKSKGRVSLKSNDPFEYPLIDTQILADKKGKDITVMYEAIQKALELVNTEAFKKINATLYHLPHPACRHKYRYLSKAYWYCQIRQLTFHLFHGIGTCRMGTNLRTSVVNNKLKVHGVSKLRVVDASIFPTQISGHTNAPVIMVAEKIADLIKLEEELIRDS